MPIQNRLQFLCFVKIEIGTMAMTQILSFISDQHLKDACKKVVHAIQRADDLVSDNPYRNIIDPFSAVFESSFNNISLTEWMEREKMRQIQKSWQNSIGTFHQDIIGKINSFEDLKTGGVIDIRSSSKKILAEIKNKYNTTKGNHKTAVYDDLETLLQKPEYQDYTGYYVAILTKKRFNKPFTPSDNKKKKCRPINEKIREIDGKSFYAMATGDPDAINKLYLSLPKIISEIKSFNPDVLYRDKLTLELFEKAFK